MAEIDKTVFKANTASLYADNTSGDISASDLRTQMDNMADSAVFKSTGNALAPTVNDDEVGTAGNGAFQVGDMWIDESNDNIYVCVNSNPTVAVWIDVSVGTGSGVITATGLPANNQLAIWTGVDELEGQAGLTYNGSEFAITGNIAVSGTVDGRDIAVDGAKLDAIDAGATNGVTISENIVGGGANGFTDIATLEIYTGTGLSVSQPGAGEIRIEPGLTIKANTVNRNIDASDNNAVISNTGAGGTVRWTVPAGLAAPLSVTFFKGAAQTMEIIGANGVTINGATESGGNETLNEICNAQYTSFATLVRTTTNTYTLYTGSVDKVGTTADNQVAVWTGDGTIEGTSGLTWDATTLDVTGAVAYNYGFNAQVGTAYTPVLADKGLIITMNNGAGNTVTLPTNATTAFPIGSWFKVIQIGAGATSIAGDVAVTLNGISAGTGALTGQWDEVTIYKVGTDEWYVTGDIGAVA